MNVEILLKRWADTEAHCDAAALDSMLTHDFTAVGPRGFVLGKREWLERYQSRALVHETFTVDDSRTRLYGDAVVVIARQQQKSRYDGHPADGDFRLTWIVVRDGDAWRVAGVHLSAIANPKG